MARASGSDLIPSWAPSGSTRRTSRARMRSLILDSPAVSVVAMRHPSRSLRDSGSPRSRTRESVIATDSPDEPAHRDPAHRHRWPGGGANGHDPAFLFDLRLYA